MNDIIQVLNIIKEHMKYSKNNTTDINFDILLSQSKQNIETILKESGQRQWQLIKLLSSEVFYYADEEYKKQVLDIVISDEISPNDTQTIVQRALTDAIIKRKDGIKFLLAAKNFKKKYGIIEKTFKVLDNEYLIEREDLFELFKLIGETADDPQKIDLILQKLQDENLAQLPNLKELLTPILSSRVNMFTLTRVLSVIYQNENALQYMNVISNSQRAGQDKIAEGLILDERIRNHKNGVIFVETCTTAKGLAQAIQLADSLKNDKILNDENSPKYMKIMASAEEEREAILIRKLLEERVKGNLSTLSEDEFTEITEKVAKCKDDRNCEYMEMLIFTFFYDKERKEEGLFEYATKLLDIISTTKPNLLRYTYNAILSIDRKQENKIDFVKAISSSKLSIETEYANKLLNNPSFMQDKNALKYIRLLTNTEDYMVYLYEIIADDRIRNKEDASEYIETVSTANDIETTKDFLKENPDISLSLLKAVAASEYASTTSCIQIIENKKIKNPLLLVKELGKIKDHEKVEKITSTITELTETDEIMEKENPEMILLPVIAAPSEEHLNYLWAMLHNKEMLQKDNLVELEQQLVNCNKEELGTQYSNMVGDSTPTIASYQPFPTLNDLSRFITFLTNEENPEGVISKIVSESKSSKETPVVKKIGQKTT